MTEKKHILLPRPCTVPSSHAWEELRRLRAWELDQQGWSQTDIAQALGVTCGAVSQWLKTARQAGPAALLSRPVPGRPPKLTPEQLAQLPALLMEGASTYGFRGEVWTCGRVAEVIQHQFGVSYHPAHVSRLLKQVDWTPQKPVRRAQQRDEAAIAAWRKRRCPALKKRQKKRGAPLSS